jgi:outer membrane protein
MTNRFKALWLCAVSIAALAAPAAAGAETLAEAMALAYESNPQLQSQRALQRQTDETYVQARAGWRPTLNATATSQYQDTPNPFQNTRSTTRRTVGQLQLNQPLFTGGRVSANIDAANATVRAGRETLRLTEINILQQVVTAYLDVLRDQRITLIRQQSVETLARQFSETQARFEAGLVARTDTARAEAQLAQSRAQLALARAALQNSRAAYTATVGRPPGQLEDPSILPGIPDSVDAAIKAGEEANPALRRAQLVEEASRARVAQARAGRMPTVSINGNYNRTANGLAYNPSTFEAGKQATLTVTVPLFTGGVLSSQIRAAQEQNTSDRILIEQQRRVMVQTLTQAWNQMLGAYASIQSNEQQVRAATVAFEGAFEQFQVGISTTLDTLLAQETLRTAEVALAQSQRDLYVAQAQVLAAAGRLEMEALAENAPHYDPNVNFDRVRNAGALPWEGLVRFIDLDKTAEDVRPRAAAPVADPAAPPVLKPGAAPAALQEADAALSASAPTPSTTPSPGGAPSGAAPR